MKKDIHPKFYECKVVCTSCGSEFVTGSTLKEIKVDTCSNCHPFYTGTQKFVTRGGRIEKFKNKYNME